MQRRDNKSHKVSNVKLRPAQPQASSSRLPETAPASSHDSEDDEEHHDNSKPFASVIICMTGLDKTLLYRKAKELGARCFGALTDKVTHLIALESGSAKYNCALECRIPIMHPSWIFDAYDAWLRGDDVDFAATLDSHRLPIFQNVNLCCSGIDSVERRAEVYELLKRHQGVYSRNLASQVTHLLCSTDDKTDKIHLAEEMNAKGTKIRLVWEQWFWDCIAFGGRFDEDKYHIRRPKPKPKLLSVTAAPSVAAKPIMKDAESEFAYIHRPQVVALQFWESLLKPRGIEMSNTGIMTVPVNPVKTVEPNPPIPQIDPNSSILASSEFRRTNSFTAASLEGFRSPFRKLQSTPAVTAGTASFFAGLRFRLLGEARCATVKSAIEGAGGQVVSGDQVVDFIVVRLLSGSKFYAAEEHLEEKNKYRTECWLERCLFEERLCEAQLHVSFVPLDVNLPIPGVQNINVSFSGYDESEQCFLRRLFRALGINLSPNFSRKCTHLLCDCGTGVKYDKAVEWGVPVVDMSWLETICKTGVVSPTSGDNSYDEPPTSSLCPPHTPLSASTNLQLSPASQSKRKNKSSASPTTPPVVVDEKELQLQKSIKSKKKRKGGF
ncbi:hypothetical protein C8J56DRAFT_951061 [Mycena floridula]|nr:hypothetical protein C8J56DRAFT_951061 [Mycena floridula]